MARVPSGALDVVMLTVNFMLQTAIDTVLPLCQKHEVGTVVMMPLNQAWKGSGLVGVAEATECVRRHIAYGNLPAEPPYTDPDLFDFLKPYSIPEAALRFVLAQRVSSCCVGARSPQRITQNLRAATRPYLDDNRLARLKELFGSIRRQVR
jgi:aryl-alcohol dehydrogenase-like predicted oxidoreductase